MKIAVCAAVIVGLAGAARAQLGGSAGLTATDLGGGMTRYAAVLHNTGTTTVGTFWYAWVPGVDFMPHIPQNIASPPGWIGIAQGGGPGNGYSVLWYASGAPGYVAPGGDLTGFGFDSADPPAVMTANSPYGLRPYITATSFLYIGGPLGDLGYQFIATVSSPPPPCYANCDGSTAAPVLNVADFTCFLQKYAAADPYANCDSSTSAPTLNVADFTCFLQKYAAGCP
jgi:hypothetical protein